MKARFALLLLALIVLATACPGDRKTPPPPPGHGDGAPPTTATALWAPQAELVVKKLEELLECVEKNDKAGALKAQDSAYFECYENANRNLEVASGHNLPEELLEGKLHNVAFMREDIFAQIKAAVTTGAPAPQVRALVLELETRIREDAKKLDDMKVAPP